MGKQMKRFKYRIKKISKSLLSECMDGFLYILWFSSRPLTEKILTSCLEDRFRKEAIYANVNRLYRKGFISKIKRKNRIMINLQKAPEYIIWSDLERLKVEKYKSKWDGLWRLVIYDIPEKQRYKRDALRRYLKELGFGKIQESCWVSPYDFSSQIHNFCATQKSLSHICIYEGNLFAGKDIDNLVEEVWRLKQLNEEYKKFIDVCKEGLEKIETEELNPKECYNVYFQLYSTFAETIRKDPFLPRVFVKDWLRESAERLFKKFSQVASHNLLRVI